MSEKFMQLSTKDRMDALGVAASASGRPVHLLEKDVWVIWALETLFTSKFADKLVFKGGTSLSKAYKVIDRFSEDVDLTYDIRALIPDLVGDSEDAIPVSRGEERRWTKQVREMLPHWVAEEIQPILNDRLADENLDAKISVEGEKLFLEYDAIATGTGYVSPSVMLEFGARSTGEPNSRRDVTCDAATYLEDVEFPTARPRVMSAERTFWEKATAIHVFCRQGRMRGERFARHWYDIVKLDQAGYVDLALKDRALANAVAIHKSMFFAEKHSFDLPIDYVAAISGQLKLVPATESLKVLSTDYEKMLTDGLLFEGNETFEELMERSAYIERRANL
jgi:Nucleotidyl transferase AbiEii toxin, Type IV TA system